MVAKKDVISWDTCHRNVQIMKTNVCRPPSVTAIGDYSESYYRGQLDRSSTAVGVWYLDWKTAINKCSQGKEPQGRKLGGGAGSLESFSKDPRVP